ncbi:MAG: polysaccharide biosynthesis/export family protein [Planctomycetes bacterium]|nr:polysaccharide biosynthesis/export family protein [Planctomycetota bacterium]
MVALFLALGGCAQDGETLNGEGPALPAQSAPPGPAAGDDALRAPPVDPSQEEGLAREKALEELTPERRQVFFPAEGEAEYRIAPNDRIEIKVYNAAGQKIEIEDVTKETRVFLDGTISLGFLGRLRARGKTPSALAEEIRGLLAEFAKEPRVSVNVLEFTKDRVVVLGDFAKSGTVEFTPPKRLLDILGEVGWSAAKESQQRVVVVRQGVPLAVDVVGMLRNHDFEKNILLQGGDLITALPRSPIVLLGETVSGPRYEIADATRISLRAALGRAGGVTFKADLAGTTLVRADGKEYALDLNQAAFAPGEEGRLETQLYAGDVVVIPTLAENQAFVFGIVDRPGIVKFNGAISVLQALAQASPKDLVADLSHVAIIRGFPLAPAVAWVNMNEIVEGRAPNPAIGHGDVIFVSKEGIFEVIDYVNRIMQPTSQALGVLPQYGYQPFENEWWTIRGTDLKGGTSVRTR